MKALSPVWQKRFGRRTCSSVMKFASSAVDDHELVPYEIACCRIHVNMLRKKMIISNSDHAALLSGLKKILADYSRGRFKLFDEYEDVHMNVEKRLKKLVGKAADNLHMARSRNDLIATELKMYVWDKALAVRKRVLSVQRSFLDKALSYRQCVIPGFTHLQQAQPVLASFYLLSYFHKFQRDFEHLGNVARGASTSPLGSCALAGTSLEIDRWYTAKRLGFEGPCENALDAVGDRDFLCEFLFCLAQLMMHISSFAEDAVIFSTSGLDIVIFGSDVTTGSSIMPQKKNPDVCELLRAKSGKTIGSLVAALAILKGLPGSYNRDLQEMKGILFGQLKETLMSLDMFKMLIRSMKFQTGKDGWQCKPQFICSTDLVDYLVKKGWRFRQAYEVIALCVRMARNDIGAFIRRCAQKTKVRPDVIMRILTPSCSVRSKVSYGSTGMKPVRSALTRAKRIMIMNERSLSRT